MIFNIYNPHTNNEVVTFYLSVIEEMLIKAGYKTRTTEKIERCRDHHQGIVVIGVIDVIYAKIFGYKNIILWVQGVEPEESYMRNHSVARRFVLSCIEYFALRHASFLFLVSEEMKCHFEKKYRISINRFYIMPCNNEVLRKDSFKTFEKYNKNTFVYVGGLQKWQCFRETLLLYVEIEKILTEAKLFIYTKNVEEAKALIRTIGIKNVHISFVPQELLYHELEDKKFGFVIRENCTVNNVATPTKLSNYLANGMIPIYTDAIKDFPKVMANRNFHIMLESIFDLNNWAKKISGSFLMSELDADEVLAEYVEIFNGYYSKELHIDRVKESLIAAFSK